MIQWNLVSQSDFKIMKMRQINYDLVDMVEVTKEKWEFPDFMKLPWHIKQKIMKNSIDTRSLLNLSETCTEMNQLLTKSPQILKRLRLVLNFTRESIENVNKLSIILANATQGRRYERLKLVHLHDAIKSPTAQSFFFKTLRLIAANVKDLEIDHCNVTSIEFQKVIECFAKLNKLSLNSVTLEDMPTHFINQDFLPNLSSLIVRESTSTFMYFFQAFDRLATFKFSLANREHDEFFYGTENFEDFIMHQKNLQTLSIGKMHRHRLRLDPFLMKSRLESLNINRFSLESQCAANFFRQQQQLKTIKLYDFYDSRIFMETNDYCQILRIIFSLPRLEFVGIFHQTIRPQDFIFLQDIRNRSVRQLEYDMQSTSAFELFMEIFPALENVSFRCRTVRLRDVSCEKLLKIQSSGNYDIEEFAYQPTKMMHDAETFEEIVKCFLIKHNSIKSLTLGHENWIDGDFSFSLNFWIEILYHLEELTELVVYNPKDIRKLAMLLELARNRFHSITFYTDQQGKHEARMLQNQYLKIVAVDHFRRVLR